MIFPKILKKLPGFFEISAERELRILRTGNSIEIALLGIPIIQSFLWQIIVLPVSFIIMVSVLWGVFIEKHPFSLSLVSLEKLDDPNLFYVLLISTAAFFYSFFKNIFFKFQKKKIFIDRNKICFSSSFPVRSYDISVADVECIHLRKSFRDDSSLYSISIQTKRGDILHLFSISNSGAHNFALNIAHSIGELIAKDVTDLDDKTLINERR